MYYYIDTENVSNADWVPALRHLKKRDVVYIFVSNNSKPVLIEYMTCIQDCVARLEFIHVLPHVKQSMDFTLVSAMGLRLSSAPKTGHRIVSHDTGFDSAIAFFKTLKFDTERIDTINDKENLDNANSTNTHICSTKACVANDN